MVWDHRPDRNQFYGIVLQEYSHEQKKLIGEPKMIFKGTDLKLTEGPHIYQKDGYYYLLVAEGGTGYEHAVTIARSKELLGEYEVHPQNPILTSYFNPEIKIQKAGHASFVKTQTDEWFMVHLCGRPLETIGNCPLGRETSIQRITWETGDWPYVVGGTTPSVEVEGPNLPECPVDATWCEKDDFDTETLNINYQTLRVPLAKEDMSLTERPGHLRL